MGIADEIRCRLDEAFAPELLEVIDESAQHKGHAGARPGGESHFRVIIEAGVFLGKSRIEQHRMVTAVLADLMDNPIHALALTARPGGGA
mgnify:CR=1 FL=1